MTTSNSPGLGLSAAAMAEAVRAAASRKTSRESLSAVIDMAVHSGPCDSASITMLEKANTSVHGCGVGSADRTGRRAAVRAP